MDNTGDCKLRIVSEKFTNSLAGRINWGAGEMMEKIRLGAKVPAEPAAGFIQSLLAPLFRSAAPAKGRVPAGGKSWLADAEASWTASLHRGADLPPFLLSIQINAGARSALRFGPFDRRPGAEPVGPEL